MEPSRKAIVESYVTHFQPPGDGMAFSGMNCSALAASTIRLVRRDVPNTPFYKQLDLADRLPDYYNPNDYGFGRGSLYDPRVQAKHSARKCMNLLNINPPEIVISPSLPPIASSSLHVS